MKNVCVLTVFITLFFNQELGFTLVTTYLEHNLIRVKSILGKCTYAWYSDLFAALNAFRIIFGVV